MAWCEKRTQSGRTTWRVVWRQDGQRQQQSFNDAAAAAEFLDGVDAAPKDTWPRGWIKGQGWADDLEPDSTAPTFRDFAARTVTARAGADERTKADYHAMLKRHVYPIIGHQPIDTITRFDVAKIAKTMRAGGKRAKTIANVHAVLSSVFDDAIQKEDPPLVRRNPARGELAKSDAEESEAVYLTKSEFAMIRNNIADADDRDLATLLVGTGLRWSEATALRVQDVDLLGRHTLSVRRAWKRRGGLFEIGTPKTRRSRRTISLSPALVDMLITRCAGRASTDLIFTTANGHPVRHSNWYNRVWRPAVLRARLCDTHAAEKRPVPCGCHGTLTKYPTIHSLRHTQASWLIDEKVSLVAIQRRLGHESIKTTIDLYGHLVPEHAEEIDAAVDRALATL